VAAGHPDFFVSGFAAGAEELGGTAAVIDEPVGDGRAVLFLFEPNFRAFTDGTQRLLRGYGARFETRRAAGQVHFSVANPRGLGIHEHPFAADPARRLRAADLPVRAFSML
jgi:hypothetical protein